MSAQDFHIDLGDLAACGVYYVTPEDIDTVARSVGNNDFNVHHIDLSGCHDQATFTARFAAGFSLPQDYAKDWSTLVNYLQDLEGLPSRGHIVLFTHTDEWLQSDTSGASATLDTLEETASIWAREGVAFFVFLPHDKAQAVAMGSG